MLFVVDIVYVPRFDSSSNSRRELRINLCHLKSHSRHHVKSSVKTGALLIADVLKPSHMTRNPMTNSM